MEEGTLSSECASCSMDGEDLAVVNQEVKDKIGTGLIEIMKEKNEMIDRKKKLEEVKSEMSIHSSMSKSTDGLKT